MKVRIRLDTVAANANLRRWGEEFRKKARLATAKALQAEAAPITQEVREHVSSRLQVKKRTFAKSFKAKLYDRNPAKLPALLVNSKVPWVGIHEDGGTIGGPLLIPLHGRVGRKRFKQIVTTLIRGGNAYFIRSHGKTVLMAENQPEYDSILGGFKRGYRKASGTKRLKRGADVPIAVLVPSVSLRKRLDVRGTTLAQIPRLARAIELRLRQLA